MREGGRVMFFGLLPKRFTSKDRQDAIIPAHEAMGCMDVDGGLSAPRTPRGYFCKEDGAKP